jgi:hypothetical protein
MTRDSVICADNSVHELSDSDIDFVIPDIEAGCINYDTLNVQMNDRAYNSLIYPNFMYCVLNR